MNVCDAKLYNQDENNYLINLMGCEACRMDTFDSPSPDWQSEGSPVTINHLSLLSGRERQIWAQHLTISGIPNQEQSKNDQEEHHSCFSQIKKDILRSFPNNTFFALKSNLHRFELLLKKFALYFPKLGYTQGLNFIAGYLLIAGFSDRKAFQLLVGLVLHDKMLLLGLYEDSFPLNKLYCCLFWKLIEKRLPKTAMKIRNAKVPDEAWIFQWFMTFYLYSFPVEFVKRLIDYIICKKQFAIVMIGVGILNCLKQEIQRMHNPD